jgi:hypothetical protein
MGQAAVLDVSRTEIAEGNDRGPHASPSWIRRQRCISCHMPAIEQTIGDVMVRSHTFKFISPSATETRKVPNPCIGCRKDKTNTWAADALKKWPGFSPWRVAR